MTVAVKSVIDIEVHDVQFKNFSAMFEKYKTALGEMPTAWKAVGTEVSGTTATFEAMLAAMIAQEQISKNIAEREKEAATAAEKKRKEEAAAARSGVLHWKDMARTTRDVAGNIVTMTTSLLKWTGIGSAISLLAGGFSLFGIDRLGAAVASGRRSSQGLGLGYGEQKSFGVNFGSAVDPNSYLSSVNQALHNLTERRGFLGAGMSSNDLQGSTAQVGTKLLEHLKKIADNTNPSAMTNVMEARSLDQFVTLEDMMRLRAMSGDEFREFNAHNTSDSETMNLSRQTQLEWLRFTQQMHRAGVQIENVFVRGLVHLEPQLRDLSSSFVKVVESIARSPEVHRLMDSLAAGLSRFATYVATPEFEENVKVFIKGVAKMGEAMIAIVKWFAEKDGPDRTGQTVFQMPGLTIKRDDRGLLERLIHPELPPPLPMEPGSSTPAPGSPSPFSMLPLRSTPGSVLQKFSSTENAQGLPPGLLNAVYGAESSSGKDARTSAAGAVGPFQLMPMTARAYGVDDPRDLDQSSSGAARLLADLKKEFKGDLAKMVAAYNWGAGNVESYVKTGHGMQGQPMPDETKEYLRKISDSLSKTSGQKVVLEINNNSGGNAVVSTSMVAQ